MTYSPEVRAVLDRLLVNTRKSALSATRWYFGTSAVIVAMAYWLDQVWPILWWVGGLGGVLIATWTCYLLTAHRIKRGYFGNNEAEAREIIREAQSN
jgi:hypothetical protein